ncbi:MAG TPA: aromatic acid exporter family protein [Pseudonocardia sp.]|nr:aromatic acid exporter family protein [Pseudonocardia sp.]
MASGWRGARGAVRRFRTEIVRRCRDRGRSAAIRAGRLTGASVAAFLVAEAVGLQDPPPLIAALTALLVVQATLASTLVNGIQRVLSVVAGVALAVLFVSVVGLSWWSLGALIAASIVVGQVMRLGPHLVEVPISAMLVLGVGYSSAAETVGAGRVIETLVGAAVGVLVNVAFPPAVQTRHAGRAVQKFAGEIAELLADAARALADGPVESEQAMRWLEDARRLNRHAPRVDRALAHAEESRRLNVRALGAPRSERSLRDSLDALEHTSVSVRTLFRATYDATLERTGLAEDPDYAAEVRRSTAALMARVAAVVGAFGRLVHAEIEGSGEGEKAGLTAALEALRSARVQAEALLIADPRGRQGLWELNSAVLTTTDRALQELDDAEHARLRSRWAEAARSDRRAARAVGRLRTRSWQAGERVNLTKRVDLGKRVRRSELGGCGPPTGSGDA